MEYVLSPQVRVLALGVGATQQPVLVAACLLEDGCDI